MLIFKTVAEAQSACAQLRGEGRILGLVPTMGALHEGHLSLARAAKAECDIVAASIFVNPTQFGPNEDFSKYPRTFEQDCALLEGEGVDMIFAPTVDEMYPSGASTFVVVEGVSDRLDGASRPGHFRGVTTVVSKLFHIIGPHKAFFGQKDAAQVAVLRKMVRDLNFPLRLVVCPIVREDNGLAMSSRNRYLSERERQQALVLRRALEQVEKRASEGEMSSRTLMETARNVFASEPDVRIDYIAVVDPETLEDVPNVRDGALVAVAAFVGTTRLIDNILL
ncbi:MAG TPA: pantoate--beta-alanine ligase [Alloacidobacterium sp.]|jgi:pantoate--beta-alanine ligase|nr:pantoate--beta-alanine ligase [Alloacidobacterium sp.]